MRVRARVGVGYLRCAEARNGMRGCDGLVRVRARATATATATARASVKGKGLGFS